MNEMMHTQLESSISESAFPLLPLTKGKELQKSVFYEGKHKVLLALPWDKKAPISLTDTILLDGSFFLMSLQFQNLAEIKRMKCLSFSSVSFAPLSLDATNLQLNSQLFCFFYAKRESIHIRSSLSSDISRFRRCGCFYRKSFGSLRWRGVRQKCLAMEEQCWHQFSYIESRP